MANSTSLDSNPSFAQLSQAVLKGDLKKVARELQQQPGLLQKFPSESAQLLAIAIRTATKKAGGLDSDNSWDEVQTALKKERALVDLLIEHGADVNGEPERQSPLHQAVALGQPMLVEALVAHGAKTNVAHPGLGTPAQIIAKRKGRQSPEDAKADAEILRLLETPPRK